jgi:hypothetical protein
VYDSGVLGDLDAQFPGRLPHAAAIMGRRSLT